VPFRHFTWVTFYYHLQDPVPYRTLRRRGLMKSALLSLNWRGLFARLGAVAFAAMMLIVLSPTMATANPSFTSGSDPTMTLLADNTPAAGGPLAQIGTDLPTPSAPESSIPFRALASTGALQDFASMNATVEWTRATHNTFEVGYTDGADATVSVIGGSGYAVAYDQQWATLARQGYTIQASWCTTAVPCTAPPMRSWQQARSWPYAWSAYTATPWTNAFQASRTIVVSAMLYYPEKSPIIVSVTLTSLYGNTTVNFATGVLYDVGWALSGYSTANPAEYGQMG